MNLSRPPYNEKDLTGQQWQKWFSSVFAVLTKFYTNKDIICENSNVGLVLKSANGHYWRLKVDNSGTITTVDLGASLP